jgi:hypothetical protein
MGESMQSGGVVKASGMKWILKLVAEVVPGKAIVILARLDPPQQTVSHVVLTQERLAYYIPQRQLRYRGLHG